MHIHIIVFDVNFMNFIYKCLYIYVYWLRKIILLDFEMFTFIVHYKVKVYLCWA